MLPNNFEEAINEYISIHTSLFELFEKTINSYRKIKYYGERQVDKAFNNKVSKTQEANAIIVHYILGELENHINQTRYHLEKLDSFSTTFRGYID